MIPQRKKEFPGNVLSMVMAPKPADPMTLPASEPPADATVTLRKKALHRVSPVRRYRDHPAAVPMDRTGGIAAHGLRDTLTTFRVNGVDHVRFAGRVMDSLGGNEAARRHYADDVVVVLGADEAVSTQLDDRVHDYECVPLSVFRDKFPGPLPPAVAEICDKVPLVAERNAEARRQASPAPTVPAPALTSPAPPSPASAVAAEPGDRLASLKELARRKLASGAADAATLAALKAERDEAQKDAREFRGRYERVHAAYDAALAERNGLAAALSQLQADLLEIYGIDSDAERSAALAVLAERLIA